MFFVDVFIIGVPSDKIDQLRFFVDRCPNLERFDVHVLVLPQGDREIGQLRFGRGLAGSVERPVWQLEGVLAPILGQQLSRHVTLTGDGKRVAARFARAKDPAQMWKRFGHQLADLAGKRSTLASLNRVE